MKKWFSLVEVLIAIAVFWFAITILTPTIHSTSSETIKNVQKIKSFELIQNEYEKLKFIRNYAAEIWNQEDDLFTNTFYPWWEEISVSDSEVSMNDLEWFFTIQQNNWVYWDAKSYYSLKSLNWVSSFDDLFNRELWEKFNSTKIINQVNINDTIDVPPQIQDLWIWTINPKNVCKDGCYQIWMKIENIWPNQSRNFPASVFVHPLWKTNFHPVKKVTIKVRYYTFWQKFEEESSYILTMIWNEKIY